MNATIEIMKSRRTCRQFCEGQISNEELNAILEAGIHAPSGMGKQSPLFIVIQDKEAISAFSKINREHWTKEGEDGFNGAPTIIAVLSNPQKSLTYRMDAMPAVMNMLNAAESLNIGSACISCAKDEFESEYGQKILEKFGIDKDYVAVEHVTLGYRGDCEKLEPKQPRENRIYKI